MPFKTATKFDPLYSCIINFDYETYWNKRNIKNNLSDSFKSLFINLIAYDPTQRPTLQEILCHPWVVENQPESTGDILQILKFDFFKRRQVVEFKRMKEKVQKEEEKKMNKVFIQRAYRSFENPNIIKDEMKLERNLLDHEENGNRYVIVFDQGTHILTLFNKIIGFFQNKKATVKTCDERYRVKVFFFEDDLNCCEHNNNPDKLTIIENLTLFVEIKRYEEEKYIVELNKRSGDRLNFFNIYEEFCSAFN
jgi:hypothetical protein